MQSSNTISECPSGRGKPLRDFGEGSPPGAAEEPKGSSSQKAEGEAVGCRNSNQPNADEEGSEKPLLLLKKQIQGGTKKNRQEDK